MKLETIAFALGFFLGIIVWLHLALRRYERKQKRFSERYARYVEQARQRNSQLVHWDDRNRNHPNFKR